MKFISILCIAFISFTSISNAEDAPLDCTSPSTQSQSRDCAAQRLAAVELQVISLFDYTRRLLADGWTNDAGQMQDNSAEFIAGQQAWFIYRDQTCHAEGLMHWGTSLEFSVADQCLERITAARLEELKKMAF